MSAGVYFKQIIEILDGIQHTQMDKIKTAAAIMAATIEKKGRVYLFGSGHSVIPVMDIFPRYGSFIGFYPIYDPRLMWSNVIGPGGARELLWLERQQGYARILLQSYSLESRDCLLVFSHGGLNTVPIELALEAKEKGLKIICVSSLTNAAVAKRTHPSGKMLADIADIAIDNGVPPEDALVDVGRVEKVAAGSTVASVSIAMSLVAETAAILAEKGKLPPTFVSPNVKGADKDNIQKVYEAFSEFYYDRPNRS
ncbi:MAG: sugar isomerase domain-containing protein [Candidatus Aminicenantes bacterium]|nr:sugar isomerase domain-containing protein [Candidatus Aminicenantes bacterium]